jgi:formamidopyrimidine-DNA glycosylase
MPEGPEIWRAAARIEKTLGSGPLVSVIVGLERLEPAEGVLLGASVLAVRPRGKALLTSFSTGHTLYSHNQLYGGWRVARAGAALRPTTRALRLSLSTAQGTAAQGTAVERARCPTPTMTATGSPRPTATATTPTQTPFPAHPRPAEARSTSTAMGARAAVRSSATAAWRIGAARSGETAFRTNSGARSQVTNRCTGVVGLSLI